MAPADDNSLLDSSGASNPVTEDMAASQAAIADRLSEEKAAARRSNNDASPIPGDASGSSQELALEKDEMSQASALAVDKSRQNGNGPAESLQDAAVELAKQQLKKRLWLYVAGPIISAIVGTAWIWLPLLVLMLVLGVTYNYWQAHWYDPSLYYYTLTSQPEKLINDAIADIDNPDYGGAKKDDDSGKSKSPTASASGGQSATGAQAPESQSTEKK